MFLYDSNPLNMAKVYRLLNEKHANDKLYVWKARKHNMSGDYRLSRDDLYNLHELAYDGDFVHRITTFPDLEIFLYSQFVTVETQHLSEFIVTLSL